MLKKIHLFIIPYCLIISEADACNPYGQANFYNDTPKRLNIKVKRVRIGDMVCFTKPKRQWSKTEEEKCSKELVSSYQDITILPKGRAMNVCWKKDARFVMAGFNVTYEDHGIMRAGPKGEITEYMENPNYSSVFVSMMQGGDQKKIKSSGCSGRFSVTCNIRFSSKWYHPA